MNKEYINKISDKELREYVSLEMQKNVNYCCKCGKHTPFRNERTGLGKYDCGIYIKLCNLCNDCYSNLLEYLEIGDV